MSRSFTADTVGIIPYDEYLRKIEQSDMPEDPEAYEKHIRRNLVDFRPDEPFFESDMPRDPSDRGSGNGSRERLALRHSGGRSEETPYLPDGTFLDHEFMERDPRGTQNLPDFAEGRRQREARGRFIKFYNDDDHSVPETGVNPVQMVSLIRGAQAQFKDRFMNFDESFDGWHNGSGQKRGKISTVQFTTTDGQIVDLADATAEQRQDPVTLLSNRTPSLGRWNESDHRVKTSKYGRIRPVMDLGANDWNTNRNNSYLDHSINVEINGQMVNRMLANVILDIEGQRLAKQVSARGATYGESEVDQNRAAIRKLDPDDLYKLIQMNLLSSTQGPTAHEQFDGSIMHRNRTEKANLPATQQAVKLNHEVLASMVQGARNIGVKHSKDIRDAVKTSAVDNGIYNENKPRNIGAKKTTDSLVREGLDTREIEESRVTKSYSMIKPTKVRKTHENADWEQYKKESQNTQERFKNFGRVKNRSVSDVQNEVDMGEFALPRRKQMPGAALNGRTQSQDFGDIQRVDSTSELDMHKTLYDMVMS